MKKVINSVPSRRHFLRLTSMAAASALAPTVLWAEQREATDSATSQAESARIATFEEVWRTVRDRFYDPHLHGLDWSAVREHYLPGATRASSEEALGGVINSMLSELHASHTRYYTPEGPEYYQLSDIFAGALRRRGLERAFPGGRISYPGVGVLSRVDMQGRRVIAGVIQGSRPNKPACSLAMRSSSLMVHRFSRCSHSVARLAGKSCWACVVPARLCKYRLRRSILSPTKCSWTA